MGAARFRLEPLIAARQLRLDAAMGELRQRHAALSEAERTRDAANGRRLTAIEARQHQQRSRAAQSAEPGVMLPAVWLSQAEQRLGWLDEQIERCARELADAQTAVDAARAALDVAIAAYRRAQAKLDALKLQRQAWQRERQQRELRVEEGAVEELLVNRYARTAG